MIGCLARTLFAISLMPLLVAGQSEDGYNTNQRINKIRQLGKTDSQAIPVLAGYLNDPDRDIRVEAVRAIIRIGGGGSLDPLVKATRDNDAEIQNLATDGIVNFYLPGYLPRGVLTAPFTRGVRQLKSLMSARNDQTIGADITVRPTVADAVSDLVAHGAGFDVRANAARAAGILRDRAALPSLQQALRTKDTTLIFESLVALQKIGDPSAGPSVSFLARDLDDRIQMTALETIGDLKASDAAPQVRLALANARNAKVTRAALAALAMLGLEPDRPTFLKYASDSDPQLRASALEGLGRLREPQDYPALEAAYNEANADWRVHLAAAFALVSEGKVDAAEFSPLRYLIENLDARNRGNIASAYLIELCRRDDARKAVFGLVQEATSGQKVALCDILAATHKQDVVPVLSTLTKNINPDVALAAARGLRTLQSPKL